MKQRKTYQSLVAEMASQVQEIFPWDLRDELDAGVEPLLLDIRCPDEFEILHIAGAINVPRGILEIAVDYGYEETVPELVQARDRRVIVICRSGNRSILAAHTLGMMGYTNVASLRTGLRGWNDDEQPLINAQGEELDFDAVDLLFLPNLTPDQQGAQNQRMV
ncbi:MAG: rhodanese-like domain-containing protein [Candidatus Thiodiazotropha sp.]|jgi:rhodanese-related sulfurtransferase